MPATHTLFSERRKLLNVREDAQQVARQIRRYLRELDADGLRALLDTQHPADLADAMQFLSHTEEVSVFAVLTPSEAAEVLDEAHGGTEANLLGAIDDARLAGILGELPADEGADLVGALPDMQAESVLSLADRQTAADIRTLLAYDAATAGGIMSLGFVDVPETATQAEAMERFRERPDAHLMVYVYVVDPAGGLLGTVDLRSLLLAGPATPVRELMAGDTVTVPPECEQEQVAAIFARYDLVALPVVAADNRLLGVITADDIIDVIQEEHNEDIAHMAGSDAHELESKSPAQVARLRLPWIMVTMFIELLAGVVVHVFDETLTRFILLASFMPIISAISGNTGLQSAAIIIRGLSTGHVELSHWRHAVKRQLATTVMLGGACAGVLGTIGGVWDGHWSFGLVVFLGMFASVNIAGVVGTVVPLLSKRAGFDPALTAGPFETAFQDVVGITIFLSLAASLLHWLG